MIVSQVFIVSFNLTLCFAYSSVADPLIGGIVASGIFLSLILMLVLSISCNRKKNKLQSTTRRRQQQNDKSNSIEVALEDDKQHSDVKVARSPSSVTYANLLPVCASTPTGSVEQTVLMQTLPRSTSRRTVQATSRPLSPSSPHQSQGQRKVTPRLERRNGSAAPADMVVDSRQVLDTILGSSVRVWN